MSTQTAAAAANGPAALPLDTPGPAVPRDPPGPKGYPFFGSVGDFRANPISFLGRVTRQHGDVVKLNLLKPAYVITHPDGVRHVLHDHHTNYKKNFIYDRLRPLLGNGLVTSSGDFWKRQRRLAQPAFHRQRIQGFSDLMAGHTSRMLDRWRERAASRRAFDVHQEMMRLTFTIMGEALFSMNLENGAEEIGPALATALEISNDRFTSFFIAPPAIPTPQNVRFARAMKVLDRVVEEIIERRRSDQAAGKDTGNDLLGMLMAVRDEDTGESMDNRQLRDEVMTMVLAGHETTANALTWAFYLLSRNPAAARRLQEEARGVLGSRAPTVADLPQLRYTQQVIDESMRLYPPVWSFGREGLEDDVILGHRILKGCSVILVPYLTHRHPDFWENPEGFDPDRFAPEQAQKRHRYAFFPFAGGPRMCIGDAFAKMEMQLVLAMIARRYALHLEPGFTTELDPSVTLRPVSGVQVTARALDPA